jgi:hypothetical protein
MAHSKAKRLTNDLISKSTLAQLIVLFSKANPASSKRGKNLLVLDPTKFRTPFEKCFQWSLWSHARMCSTGVLNEDFRYAIPL